MEISQAIKKHMDAGGRVFFLTMTVPHGWEAPLKETLEVVSRSRQAVWRQRDVSKSLRQRAQILGRVTAIETTHGQNGWHPHVHELLFTGVDCDESTLSAVLYRAWSSAVVRNGGSTPSANHGISVREVTDAEDAVSRYAVFGSDLARAARELTSSHNKTSKRGGRTPWDLLIAADEGDSYAAKLWVEFSKAFEGRATVYWSRGLKAHFGIGETTDDKVVEDQEQYEAQSATSEIRITTYDFALLCRYKARAGALKVTESFGEPGLRAMLRMLRAQAEKELADYLASRTWQQGQVEPVPLYARRLPALVRQSKGRETAKVETWNR